MQTIRWGILGCGRIAKKFAADLALVADAELFALGARQLSTATEFAREFPAENCMAVTRISFQILMWT